MCFIKVYINKFIVLLILMVNLVGLNLLNVCFVKKIEEYGYLIDFLNVLDSFFID